MNPNDKAAEEKFKEVQEAYDILSDDKKRKVFDRFGYYSDNLDPDSPFGASAGGGLARVASTFPVSPGTLARAEAEVPADRRAFAIFSPIFSAVAVPVAARGHSVNRNHRARYRRKDAISRFRSR